MLITTTFDQASSLEAELSRSGVAVYSRARAEAQRPAAAARATGGREFTLYWKNGSDTGEATTAGARAGIHVMTGEALKEAVDPFAAVERKLGQFRDLPAGWDTYDADPISGKSVRAARRLLRVMRETAPDPRARSLRPYHVAPIAHGGVQLEWRGPQGDLEVEISPEGTYSYLLIQRSGRERHFTEQDPTSIGELLRLINQTTG